MPPSAKPTEYTKENGLEFFNSREELRKRYPLADFLSQANHRIVILGGSLEFTSVQRINTIKKTLENKNILIEFLFQNPKWVQSVGLNKATITTLSPTYKEGIVRSLGTLCNMMNELSASKRNKCVIKTYESHATHSGIAIDPDHPEGKIQVEFYPYGTEAESRPSIVIHREKNETAFATWYKSFEEVLDTAKEYECPKEAEKPEEVVSIEKRETPQQSIISSEVAYSNLTKKFNRTLKAVEQTSDPETRALDLDKLYDEFRDLCYNYEWDKAKGEVEKILDYAAIPEKLFGDPNAKRYVQFLAVVINRFGEHVIDIISKKWLGELDRFYNEPNYCDKTSIPNLLYVLLELRRYSKGYVMKLVDDAATQWSVHELKKRDESAHEEIVSYLRGKWEDAKRSGQKIAQDRLKTLFDMANK
jgi:hypothetical protein